jgi:hypothetical protein
MANYVEVNEACMSTPLQLVTVLTLPQDKAILPDPRPARTCICVKELPGGTDVRTVLVHLV